jgi:para-aminobenzoate synthetase component I
LRQKLEISIFSTNNVIDKLLFLSQQEDYFCLLNTSADIGLHVKEYDFIVGLGSQTHIQSLEKSNFEYLQKELDSQNDYWFGYFSYDLKNEIENLTSTNEDVLLFPEMFFFVPEIIVKSVNNTLEFIFLPHFENKVQTIISLLQSEEIPIIDFTENHFHIKAKTSFDEYVKNVHQIKTHIQQGDIYEMNYCINFYAKNCTLSPQQTYSALNKFSPTPFSVFLKINHLYAICASPERFLKKIKNNIISQPIKGTAPRGNNEAEDSVNKKQLYSSSKERSENVMIVDLVRNDLSKSAQKGSVKVEELMGVYSFTHVHQMISTISALAKENSQTTQIIKNAFPMGSMTGAPKIKAMELIEKFENTKRGLYAGAIGYFDENQNFDFNVVIRSILYNQEQKTLSYTVGSAITIHSEPAKEYEECLLKAKAIENILTPKTQTC